MEARNMQLLSEMGSNTVSDQSFTARLCEKWAPLLKGINDPIKRGVTAMLIENQVRHLRGLQEQETKTSQIAYFTKWIFPVLRKVFPNLIANEIVSVQPMTAPVGAVFHFKYVYGSSKGGTSAGDEMIANFDRYYSSEYVDGEHIATGDGAKYGGAGAALAVTLAWNPVRPKDSTMGGNWKVAVQDEQSDGTVDQAAEDDGAGSFTGDVSSGAIDYTTGEITNFKFTAAPSNGNLIKAYYRYDSEFNDSIPEVYLELAMETVKAESRKLKIRWSPEVSDDLRAMQGMDAESELVTGISQEATLELDREIIMDLLNLATLTTDAWDRSVPAGMSELDHIRTLITVISRVANVIHKKTLRAPANFIVTSPEIASLFALLSGHGDYRPTFSSANAQNPLAPTDYVVRPVSYGPVTSNFGVTRIGTLLNRWAVYQDPYFPVNKILVGLRGRSFMDSGYVWAPYVPLEMTNTFLHPDDQGYRKGLRTRYATKELRQEYYGTITVSNL